MQRAPRMERITVTIEKDAFDEIRRRAGKRGVSAYLNRAAIEALERDRLLGWLDELDREHGSAPESLKAEIDADARRIFGMTPAQKAGGRPSRARRR